MSDYKTQGHFVVVQADGEIGKIPAILTPHKERDAMSYPEQQRADASFEQWQSIVGSGEIFYQANHNPDHKERIKGVNVYINRNGHNLELPFNAVASSLFGHELVGDVLITKAGMYSDGLPENQLTNVLEIIEILKAHPWCIAGCSQLGVKKAYTPNPNVTITLCEKHYGLHQQALDSHLAKGRRSNTHPPFVHTRNTSGGDVRRRHL